MVNGIIDIELFKILDQIAKDHGIQATKWAKAGGLKHTARISELRAMANEHPRKNIGRAFTVEKCRMALDGLIEILGVDVVTKELLALLQKAKTEREKVLIMVLALNEDKLVALRMIIEGLLKS